MENQDLTDRLKQYASFLEDTIKMFEEMKEHTKEHIKLETNKFGKYLLRKNYEEELAKIISYVHARDKLYEIFPELRLEKSI